MQQKTDYVGRSGVPGEEDRVDATLVHRLECLVSCKRQQGGRSTRLDAVLLEDSECERMTAASLDSDREFSSGQLRYAVDRNLVSVEDKQRLEEDVAERHQIVGAHFGG